MMLVSCAVRLFQSFRHLRCGFMPCGWFKRQSRSFKVSKFQSKCKHLAMLVSCAMRLFQGFIAPAVLFQSSRFHRLAIQSFIASLFHATVLCCVRLRRSVVLKCGHNLDRLLTLLEVKPPEGLLDS